MNGTAFHDVNLGNAIFNDVNLGGAIFRNVNLVNVSIDEACIDGLTIWGFDVRALIEAEYKRREKGDAE